MAEINKQVLGKLSGTLGDIVFRQRSGKNYVAMRPSSYHASESPAAVAKREKFLLAIQLGSSINSNSYLKEIWRGYTPSGLIPFNYMVSKNYNNILNGAFTSRTVLAPAPGFIISAVSFNLAAGALTAELMPLGNSTGIDTSKEPVIYFSSVVYLSSPIDPMDNAVQFLSLISTEFPVDLANNIQINIPLTPSENDLVARYQTKQLFGILNTVDAQNNPVHFSITISA